MQIESLRKKLRERVQLETESIADGAAQSLEAYREMVGIRTGLIYALQEVEDLIKKLENEA